VEGINYLKEVKKCGIQYRLKNYRVVECTGGVNERCKLTAIAVKNKKM
jgi:hypothetical protein